MGVKKLTTFIEDKYRWRYLTLTDTKLVIDGFALCFTLYFAHHSNTWYYGGDYHEYYDTVSSFFAKLQQNKIEAYVVLDGIDIDQTKKATIRKRTLERSKDISRLEIASKNVAPLHLIQVFLDILQEKHIKFCVADEEADCEIASLANQFRCPVLSQDSDFYVFKLEGGYIPLTQDNRKDLTTGRPVKIFFYKSFSQQFSIQDDTLVLFLPFFLGNDFHRSPLAMSSLGFSEIPAVKDVVKYIQKFRSFDNGVRSLKSYCYCLERLVSIQHYYTTENVTFEDLKKPSKLLTLSQQIPPWVLIAYKKGQFNMSLMSLLAIEPKQWQYWNVVEDTEQESAWEFTRNIREVTMAILTPTDRNISTAYKVMPNKQHAELTVHSSIPNTDVTISKPVEPDVQDIENVSTNDFIFKSVEENVDAEPEFDSDIGTPEESDNALSNSNSKICCTEIVEVVRVPGEYRIKENLIQIQRGPIHDMIDYTLQWRRPDSRRKALLVIADCCEINDKLITIRENLQLAVIATHYWVKKNREYQVHLQALISCILTCYQRRRKVWPRRLPTTASLRPLAHVFAHWQCTLHNLIALNQVLNQPYKYTSPGYLFSGSILHYFLESKNYIHDQVVPKLIDVIMHKI